MSRRTLKVSRQSVSICLFWGAILLVFSGCSSTVGPRGSVSFAKIRVGDASTLKEYLGALDASLESTNGLTSLVPAKGSVPVRLQHQLYHVASGTGGAGIQALQFPAEFTVLSLAMRYWIAVHTLSQFAEIKAPIVSTPLSPDECHGALNSVFMRFNSGEDELREVLFPDRPDLSSRSILFSLSPMEALYERDDASWSSNGIRVVAVDFGSASTKSSEGVEEFPSAKAECIALKFVEKLNAGSDHSVDKMGVLETQALLSHLNADYLLDRGPVTQVSKVKAYLDSIDKKLGEQDTEFEKFFSEFQRAGKLPHEVFHVQRTEGSKRFAVFQAPLRIPRVALRVLTVWASQFLSPDVNGGGVTESADADKGKGGDVIDPALDPTGPLGSGLPLGSSAVPTSGALSKKLTRRVLSEPECRRVLSGVFIAFPFHSADLTALMFPDLSPASHPSLDASAPSPAPSRGADHALPSARKSRVLFSIAPLEGLANGDYYRARRGLVAIAIQPVIGTSVAFTGLPGSKTGSGASSNIEMKFTCSRLDWTASGSAVKGLSLDGLKTVSRETLSVSVKKYIGVTDSRHSSEPEDTDDSIVYDPAADPPTDISGDGKPGDGKSSGVPQTFSNVTPSSLYSGNSIASPTPFDPVGIKQYMAQLNEVAAASFQSKATVYENNIRYVHTVLSLRHQSNGSHRLAVARVSIEPKFAAEKLYASALALEDLARTQSIKLTRVDPAPFMEAGLFVSMAQVERSLHLVSDFLGVAAEIRSAFSKAGNLVLPMVPLAELESVSRHSGGSAARLHVVCYLMRELDGTYTDKSGTQYLDYAMVCYLVEYISS